MSVVSNAHPITNISSHLYPQLESFSHAHFCSTVTYIRLTAVLLLRAGYVLIQIGTIPINDVYSIIFHNILDISVTLCSYGLVGYMFSYSRDSLGGFVGSSSSFYTGYVNLDEIIYGFSACLIGSAVITTMLSGRVLSVAAGGTSFLYSGLILPIVMHWIWHDKGWMGKWRISGMRFSMKDYAGGVVIHLTSGVGALWGCVCLGRRLVRLKDVHDSSLGTASPGTSFIGYTFVILGLISFSLPTQKYEFQRIPNDFIGIILVNSMMALTSGLFVVLMQCFCFGRTSGYWILLKCLEGCVAGLVTVSPGIDVYDHFVAFLIAVLGALVFYTVSIVLERMFYEDYSNLVSIHVVCAFIGAILPPIMANKENLGFTINFSLRIYYALWQLMCATAVLLWSTIFFLPLFLSLQLMGLLANKAEETNHQRSLNVLKNLGNPNSFWRIFTFSEFSTAVEPGSETRSSITLEKVKNQYEERRQTLQAALARKQRKAKNVPAEVEQPQLISAHRNVKNMGILDTERYPSSCDAIMERRLKNSRLDGHASMVLISPTTTTRSAEVHRTSADSQTIPAATRLPTDKYEGTAKKRVPARKKPKTVRRKRRIKRLDSSYNFARTSEKRGS